MMTDTPPTNSEIEETLSQEAVEKYSEKALTGEEREDALREHAHHHVRDTESQITMNIDVLEGMETELTVTVPDTYCFTCDEWVGLSGVDLTGKPRSKADAYYLGGAPEPVERLQQAVQHTVADMTGHIIDTHPDVNDPEEAADFIIAEIESIQGQLTVAESGRNDNESEKE